MIDREEEISVLKHEIVERYPSNLFRILLNNVVIGTIYIKDNKEKTFWISTLEIMNEKLRRRELSL